MFLVPWNRCVDLFGGDEGALERRLGLRDDQGKRRRASSRSLWKEQGVPVQNLGRELYEAWQGGQPQRPGELDLTLRRIERLWGTQTWKRLLVALELVDPPESKRLSAGRRG